MRSNQAHGEWSSRFVSAKSAFQDSSLIVGGQPLAHLLIQIFRNPKKLSNHTLPNEINLIVIRYELVTVTLSY